MNILNLLTKEKHVVGLEIGDKVIRITYFHPKKKSVKKIDAEKRELILIEESIPANIIKEGTVTDIEMLSKTLKDIWTRAKLDSNYAIVTIPEDKIYSRIFPFPKTVDETKLKEAVKLAIDFQLPVKKDEVYLDYENTNNSENSRAIHEVLVSTIPKKVANEYIEALNHAGIKVLALESALASIGRAIKLDANSATLLIKKNQNGVTIFILKDGFLQFSRALPESLIQEKDFLENETKNIRTSFESGEKISVSSMLLSEATIKDEYLKYQELGALAPTLQSKWLIPLGAAIRGEINEGEDNHISLLPISTVEAYAYQKTTTFITLVRNMTIGVSIFFVFTFLATYFFIFYLSQSASGVNSNISTSLISSDILQKETWIKNINGATSASALILSSTPLWNILLDDINAHIIGGIIITNFSVSSINDPMRMVGVAQDRNTLNQFKKSLQTSEYLSAVELPIANLELKGDIPFSISFRLKDPSMLYYK